MHKIEHTKLTTCAWKRTSNGWAYDVGSHLHLWAHIRTHTRRRQLPICPFATLVWRFLPLFHKFFSWPYTSRSLLSFSFMPSRSQWVQNSHTAELCSIRSCLPFVRACLQDFARLLPPQPPMPLEFHEKSWVHSPSIRAPDDQCLCSYVYKCATKQWQNKFATYVPDARSCAVLLIFFFILLFSLPISNWQRLAITTRRLYMFYNGHKNLNGNSFVLSRNSFRRLTGMSVTVVLYENPFDE